MEHMILPRRSHYARSLFKWVLHVVVKIFIFFRHGLKYHTVPTLLLAMFTIGSIVYFTNDNVSLPFLGTRGAPVYYPDGRPIAAEQYLVARQVGDAEKLWETYSESLKQKLIASGRTVQDDQIALMSDSLRGIRYGKFEHLFGTKLENGETLHVYLIESIKGSTAEETANTFIIGRDGKIELMW